MSALKEETEEEYTFNDTEHDGVWITFKEFSLRLHKTYEGMEVTAYQKGGEGQGELETMKLSVLQLVEIDKEDEE